MAKVFNGTAGNNNMNGSWGDDSINGGAGADTMSGGGGNDIYIVDNAGDVVREVPTFKIYNDTAIELVSVTAGGTNGNGDSGVNAITISGNGNLVGFFSDASNLLASDTNGAFIHEFNVRNMATGGIITAHTTSANAQPPQGAGGGPDNGYSSINMTPDGRYVVFSSSSVGLIPAQDNTTDGDIFVKDLLTGAITIESQPFGAGVSLGYHSTSPQISDNGRYVVFTATDNLVAATDDNGFADTDVYWRDRQTGELRMVSGEFNGSVQGSTDSAHATVTNDGRLVLFESAATNFTTPGFDTLGNSDLFIRDMVADTVQMITGAVDNVSLANGSSYDGSITPDGHYVVFTSSANNLIAGDLNVSADIFRQDLTTGAVIRVNTTATGAEAGGGQHAQITPDGRYVVFESTSTGLVTVAGDSNAITKIFIKDLVTGNIEMVSRTSTGGALTGFSAYAPQISDDGRFIVFNTQAVLNPGDSLTNDDVYRVPNPFYSPIDEVRSSVTYTLPANVENLLLTGAVAINGTGNTLNNVLTGNTANNTLNGSSGNDTLNGGAGNDTMAGGAGNDTYVRNATGDVVSELAGQGTDTVQSSVTYTLGANVENLTLTGAVAINGIGNTQNNVLTGNSGNNVLNGSTGNDTMAGGLGNDTYVRNVATDVVSELAGQGTDTVQSSVTYTLLPNFENLTLIGTAAINGTGNTVNNVITGNTAANVLNGGAGNDTLNGSTGADTLNGGDGNDTLVWDTADVSISGGTGTDTLRVDGATALNLTGVPNTKILNVETINLAGTNTLTLTLADVLAISSTTDILRVDGAAGDTVHRGGGWTQGADQGGYNAYTQGLATLLVDADINSVV